MREDDRQRFIILTPGRTGSTLLAAALAGAGASFGMPRPQTWDRRSGDMESRLFAQATRGYERADLIAEGAPKPELPLRRALWALHRHTAKRRLADALSAARYFKAVSAEFTLQPTARLGYRPRVILSYRKLEPFVASSVMLRGHVTPDAHIARYVRTMRNGLAAVTLFGGCVVSYEDLQDGEASDWAFALGKLTGLDPLLILHARSEILSASPPDPEMPRLCREAERLWHEAEAMRGIAFAGLRPANRVERAAAAQETRAVA